MKIHTIPIALAAALALGGCAGGQGLEVFQQFEGASKIIAKGKNIQDEAAKKLAIGFDVYCSKTPTVVRDYVRGVVNSALVTMGSKYRASNFCAVVE